MSELVVESRPDPQRGSVPVRFGLPGEPFQEVEVVLDWWPGEGHRYFRVRLRDGSEYVLRQDLASGAWRLDFFRDEGR
ncbi:MAG: hypothetical protein QNK03_18685 [Myxococcota bacterium]|nr:hypothetical protein [Myxococcota bacterium]